MHAKPEFLYDCLPRRLMFSDMITYLHRIGCTDCIASSYAWKAKLSPTLANKLELLRNQPTDIIIVDLTIEELPTKEEKNYVPLVGLNYTNIANYFPQYKKQVLPSFLPYQFKVDNQKNIQKLKSNTSGDAIKFKVYAKMAHFLEDDLKCDSINIPKYYSTYKKSIYMMREI
jgi:hypothetical protein